MQKARPPRGKWQNVVLPLAALLILAADQLSKMWVRSNLAVGQSLFELGFFQIIRVRPNTGAVFGLFPGHTFILTIVGLVGIVALLVYAFFIYRRFPRLNNILSKAALGLILGGALGNLIDRLNPSLGGVTDFISIGIWPAFNIADSAIVVGVIIFAYSFRSLARAGRG
jgi:signal peptidase II